MTLVRQSAKKSQAGRTESGSEPRGKPAFKMARETFSRKFQDVTVAKLMSDLRRGQVGQIRCEDSPNRVSVLSLQRRVLL